MSAAKRKSSRDSGKVEGSGPDGSVQITDIRSKLAEIRGEVDTGVDKAKPLATYVAVGVVVAVVAVSFILGKRRGRRKSTWVEIRRR